MAPIVCGLLKLWLKGTVKNSVIIHITELYDIPLSGKTGFMHNMGKYACILKTLFHLQFFGRMKEICQLKVILSISNYPTTFLIET